jgi:hypothetical protein
VRSEKNLVLRKDPEKREKSRFSAITSFDNEHDNNICDTQTREIHLGSDRAGNMPGILIELK